jgi:cytochrome c oxidase assembly protein subunit 15
MLFGLPFLYFLVRRQVDRSLAPKLVFLFVLGGLQGLMGWYMVQSGMVDDPHVSQYRLTAHLLLAIFIYGYMLWLALDLLRGRDRVKVRTGWLTGAFCLTGLVLLTIASGGFVAGLKAGFTYNTFPLMNGQWVPDGLLLMEPLWRNLFENITTVQFNHRLLAIGVALVVVAFWWSARKRAHAAQVRLALDLFLAAVLLQVSLGITTLLMVVPIPLAAAHQAGAVILLTAVINAADQLRRPDAFA